MRKIGFSQDIFYEIKDKRIIKVINSIPRERFIPQEVKGFAYLDNALPIGLGQTISQPSLVAYMTQLLMLTGNEKVLEIGTGSGYQTAILGKLASEIYTIEIHDRLQQKARQALTELNIKNIRYKLGNGHKGWVEHAPYDRIMVTAAPKEVPSELLKQLKNNGRMVVPVGDEKQIQILKVIVKTKEDFYEKDKQYVRFVPMVE